MTPQPDPTHPSTQPHIHNPTHHPKEPPPRMQPIDSNDPWSLMFKDMGATPEDIQKFKEGVINTVIEQFKHEAERQREALRKMREEE